jgi:uncharacterized membrane protein YbhN (UPF0104 family)
MKTLKIIDLVVQLLLTFGGGAWALSDSEEGGRILYLYCGVGAWQLLSFFFHLSRKEEWLRRRDRRRYGITLLWLLAIGLVSLAVQGIIIYLFLLLIVSPILAVCYFGIGLMEVNSLYEKPSMDSNRVYEDV